MNEKLIRYISLAASVIGLGASLLSDWARGKSTDLLIEKKIIELLKKGEP